MKALILGVALMMSVAMNAQTTEKKPKEDGLTMRQHRVVHTPEQRAELHAKKLTLELGLNDKQQKDAQKILLNTEVQKQKILEENKANRAAGKKFTDEEKFALKSKRLDDQIATKNEFKKILTAEQFAKFEALNAEKKGDIRKGHKSKIQPAHK